jgi:hypothetical protein
VSSEYKPVAENVHNASMMMWGSTKV